MAVEAMLGDELDRLTRKAVELALGGDTTALKICLDGIAPIIMNRLEARIAAIEVAQKRVAGGKPGGFGGGRPDSTSS